VDELGARLREARESQGLSLQQVEEVTRIRLAFLEALEEERFDDLPGDVYAMGFIRNYAQFLNLDPQELVDSFKAARGGFPTDYVPKVLDEPLVPRQRGNRWAGAFMALMLLAVLALGAWYIYQRFYLGVEPGPIVIPQFMSIGKTPTYALTGYGHYSTQQNPHQLPHSLFTSNSCSEPYSCHQCNAHRAGHDSGSGNGIGDHLAAGTSGRGVDFWELSSKRR